eukprot:scaffold881_cov123-Isochrysis_galbana.AAC.5
MRPSRSAIRKVAGPSSESMQHTSSPVSGQPVLRGSAGPSACPVCCRYSALRGKARRSPAVSSRAAHTPRTADITLTSTSSPKEELRPNRNGSACPPVREGGGARGGDSVRLVAPCRPGKMRLRLGRYTREHLRQHKLREDDNSRREELARCLGAHQARGVGAGPVAR